VQVKLLVGHAQFEFEQVGSRNAEFAGGIKTKRTHLDARVHFLRSFFLLKAD
jgi:hypothetical protein